MRFTVITLHPWAINLIRPGLRNTKKMNHPNCSVLLINKKYSFTSTLSLYTETKHLAFFFIACLWAPTFTNVSP